MKKIEFIPGYYEWHLLIDGQLVWVELDGDIDTIYENDNGYQQYFNGQILASDLEAVVDGLVNYIRYNALHDFRHHDEKPSGFDFTEEMADTLYSLTDEEWDEVSRVIYNAWAYHYGVRDRRFKYGDLTFEAVGNIKGGYKVKCDKVLDFTNKPTDRKFDNKDFYKVAKKNHCSVDVYRIIGDYDNFYMLCSDKFRQVKIDEDFKSCDSYTHWYN